MYNRARDPKGKSSSSVDKFLQLLNEGVTEALALPGHTPEPPLNTSLNRSLTADCVEEHFDDEEIQINNLTAIENLYGMDKGGGSSAWSDDIWGDDLPEDVVEECINYASQQSQIPVQETQPSSKQPKPSPSSSFSWKKPDPPKPSPTPPSSSAQAPKILSSVQQYERLLSLVDDEEMQKPISVPVKPKDKKAPSVKKPSGAPAAQATTEWLRSQLDKTNSECKALRQNIQAKEGETKILRTKLAAAEEEINRQKLAKMRELENVKKEMEDKVLQLKKQLEKTNVQMMFKSKEAESNMERYRELKNFSVREPESSIIVTETIPSPEPIREPPVPRWFYSHDPRPGEVGSFQETAKSVISETITFEDSHMEVSRGDDEDMFAMETQQNISSGSITKFEESVEETIFNQAEDEVTPGEVHVATKNLGSSLSRRLRPKLFIQPEPEAHFIVPPKVDYDPDITLFEDFTDKFYDEYSDDPNRNVNIWADNPEYEKGSVITPLHEPKAEPHKLKEDTSQTELFNREMRDKCEELFKELVKKTLKKERPPATQPLPELKDPPVKEDIQLKMTCFKSLEAIHLDLTSLCEMQVWDENAVPHFNKIINHVTEMGRVMYKAVCDPRHLVTTRSEVDSKGCEILVTEKPCYTPDVFSHLPLVKKEKYVDFRRAIAVLGALISLSKTVGALLLRTKEEFSSFKMLRKENSQKPMETFLPPLELTHGPTPNEREVVQRLLKEPVEPLISLVTRTEDECKLLVDDTECLDFKYTVPGDELNLKFESLSIKEGIPFDAGQVRERYRFWWAHITDHFPELGLQNLTQMSTGSIQEYFLKVQKEAAQKAVEDDLFEEDESTIEIPRILPAEKDMPLGTARDDENLKSIFNLDDSLIVHKTEVLVKEEMTRRNDHPQLFKNFAEDPHQEWEDLRRRDIETDPVKKSTQYCDPDFYFNLKPKVTSEMNFCLGLYLRNAKSVQKRLRVELEAQRDFLREDTGLSDIEDELDLGLPNLEVDDFGQMAMEISYPPVSSMDKTENKKRTRESSTGSGDEVEKRLNTGGIIPGPSSNQPQEQTSQSGSEAGPSKTSTFEELPSSKGRFPLSESMSLDSPEGNEENSKAFTNRASKILSLCSSEASEATQPLPSDRFKVPLPPVMSNKKRLAPLLSSKAYLAKKKINDNFYGVVDEEMERELEEMYGTTSLYDSKEKACQDDDSDHEEVPPESLPIERFPPSLNHLELFKEFKAKCGTIGLLDIIYEVIRFSSALELSHSFDPFFLTVVDMFSAMLDCLPLNSDAIIDFIMKIFREIVYCFPSTTVLLKLQAALTNAVKYTRAVEQLCHNPCSKMTLSQNGTFFFYRGTCLLTVMCFQIDKLNPFNYPEYWELCSAFINWVLYAYMIHNETLWSMWYGKHKDTTLCKCVSALHLCIFRVLSNASSYYDLGPLRNLDSATMFRIENLIIEGLQLTKILVESDSRFAKNLKKRYREYADFIRTMKQIHEKSQILLPEELEHLDILLKEEEIISKIERAKEKQVTVSRITDEENVKEHLYKLLFNSELDTFVFDERTIDSGDEDSDENPEETAKLISELQREFKGFEAEQKGKWNEYEKQLQSIV